MSSVMAWSNTLPKEKQETDDPELQDEESETEEVQEPTDEQVEKKVYVKFVENDYPLRYAIKEETRCPNTSSLNRWKRSVCQPASRSPTSSPTYCVPASFTVVL